MPVNNTYRQPATMILILVLWCASIFGSTLVTCCLGLAKNDMKRLDKSQIIQLTNHKVQWMNAEEVRVDGVLYDVVSGTRNDEQLEVVADIAEQKVLSYISELNSDNESSTTPAKQKQQLKFFPDLFFEIQDLNINNNSSLNNFYHINGNRTCVGYYRILSQPPECI